MNRFALSGLILLATAASAAVDITSALKNVEKRYNGIETLQVNFTEVYRAPGRGRRSESGVLFLHKPGRMRWEYTNPEGKLFLGDGKYFYLYTPDSGKVQKSAAKETADMRAPLAFLLGKIDFNRDFSRFVSRPEGNDLWIAADPKSEDFPYQKVEFLVTPEYQIQRVRVTGQDQSILDFTFQSEKVNPALDAKLFQFQLPPGAQMIEAVH
jgi:outer membrane lipoprotein carrier protein